MPAIVTFDPINLRIVEIDTGGDNELDFSEIYSEWKVWVAADPIRMGHPPAFRVVGGDPTSDTASLGVTLFLLNGWKLRPAERDHELKLNGNIFTDPAGQNIHVPTLGGYTVSVLTEVSNLVEIISPGLTPSQEAMLTALYQMRGLELGTPVDYLNTGSISFGSVTIESTDIAGGKRVNRTS